MRAIVIAALVAAGIGLVSAAPTSAAPANGTAIGKAAGVGQVVHKAHSRWWRRHHRHHRYYRYHRHG